MGVSEGVSLKRKCVALSPSSSLLSWGNKKKIEETKREREKKVSECGTTARLEEKTGSSISVSRGNFCSLWKTSIR